MKHLIFILLIVAVSGCRLKPLKPGTTGVRTSAAGMTTTLKQPENPAQASALNVEETTTEEFVIPAGALSIPVPGTNTSPRVPVPGQTANSSQPGTPPNLLNWYVYSDKPVTMKRTTVRKAGTTIGAAQKDTAREVAARLAAVAWISWVGIIVALFGVATFTPWLQVLAFPIRVRIGIVALGLGLTFAPMIIAGNEKWILAAAIVGAAVWFGWEKIATMIHERAYLKGVVDANKNGVDDRVEDLLGRMALAKTDAEINQLVEMAADLPSGTAALTRAAEDRRKELLAKPV